jgi:hypothetical protein
MKMRLFLILFVIVFQNAVPAFSATLSSVAYVRPAAGLINGSGTGSLGCGEQSSGSGFNSSACSLSDFYISYAGILGYSGTTVDGMASARGEFGNLGAKTSINLDGPLGSSITALASTSFTDAIMVLDANEFLANNPEVESVKIVIPIFLSGGVTGETTGGFSSAEVNSWATFGRTLGDPGTYYRSEGLSRNGGDLETLSSYGNLGSGLITRI